MSKRKRLGKAERAAKRLALQNSGKIARATHEGLTDMSDGVSYGASCMANLADFRPGSKKWGYDPRSGAKHERSKARIRATVKRIDKAAAKS